MKIVFVLATAQSLNLPKEYAEYLNPNIQKQGDISFFEFSVQKDKIDDQFQILFKIIKLLCNYKGEKNMIVLLRKNEFLNTQQFMNLHKMIIDYTAKNNAQIQTLNICINYCEHSFIGG